MNLNLFRQLCKITTNVQALFCIAKFAIDFSSQVINLLLYSSPMPDVSDSLPAVQALSTSLAGVTFDVPDLTVVVSRFP